MGFDSLLCVELFAFIKPSFRVNEDDGFLSVSGTNLMTTVAFDDLAIYLLRERELVCRVQHKHEGF